MNCCEQTSHGRPWLCGKLLSWLLAAGLIAVSIVAVSLAGKAPYNPEASFTGIGKIKAKPDIALVSLAVRTAKEADAATAVSKNSEAINKITAMLKSKDIAEKDIKSTSFNVNPVYSYPTNEAAKVEGYEAYQELQVKIRDLNKIGQVIADSSKLGANQIGNISFTIDDPENLKAQAREKAVAAAKEKAKQMQTIAGIKLGRLINVYENSYDDQPSPYYAARSDIATGLGGGGSVPQVSAGENEIRVDVTLVFRVKK
jgi:uncharacterized protein YggE